MISPEKTFSAFADLKNL